MGGITFPGVFTIGVATSRRHQDENARQPHTLCATNVAHSRMERPVTVTSKIRKQGGAAVMTIPPALLRLMDVDIGTQVTLTVEDRKLVVRPAASAPRKRYSLADLLKGAEAVKQLNADVAWARNGDPAGHEFA
jgi:antitoxin ChpS